MSASVHYVPSLTLYLWQQVVLQAPPPFLQGVSCMHWTPDDGSIWQNSVLEFWASVEAVAAIVRGNAGQATSSQSAFAESVGGVSCIEQ